MGSMRLLVVTRWEDDDARDGRDARNDNSNIDIAYFLQSFIPADPGPGGAKALATLIDS